MSKDDFPKGPTEPPKVPPVLRVPPEGSYAKAGAAGLNRAAAVMRAREKLQPTSYGRPIPHASDKMNKVVRLQPKHMTGAQHRELILQDLRKEYPHLTDEEIIQAGEGLI